MVQWLGFCTFTTEDPGSIPGQGTNPTSHVVWIKIKNLKKKKSNQDGLKVPMSLSELHKDLLLTLGADLPFLRAITLEHL